jgi:acyl-CoA thioester hydrolase
MLKIKEDAMGKKIYEFYAGWKDIDFNQHMKNTAFLEKVDDVRMMFFAENGLLINEFARLRIGPVVFKDEVEYFKEINMLEKIKISIETSGMSEDGTRFIIKNEFFRPDGKMAARITSYGTWIDLDERKVRVPPEKIQMMMKALPKADDYKEIPSGVK